MRSAVVNSPLYLRIREKEDYMMKIISLEIANHLTEKGQDCLRTGCFAQGAQEAAPDTTVAVDGKTQGGGMWHGGGWLSAGLKQKGPCGPLSLRPGRFVNLNLRGSLPRHRELHDVRAAPPRRGRVRAQVQPGKVDLVHPAPGVGALSSVLQQDIGVREPILCPE